MGRGVFFCPDAEFDMEYRSDVDFAFVKQVSRHLPRQLAGDMQAKAGTLRRFLAVVIKLPKTTKDPFFHSVRNTAPIIAD